MSASAIKDFADDKSQSKLSDARGYMSEIERTIREVDQIKGTDRKANQIASNWPDYVKAFVPAAAALQAIKDQQFNLDEAAGKCDAASRELNDKLRAYVDNNDPDGLTDGPKLATEACAPSWCARCRSASRRPASRSPSDQRASASQRS